MVKATVDNIVFETDTAQDLGLAVATYKSEVTKAATSTVEPVNQEVASDSGNSNTTLTI